MRGHFLCAFFCAAASAVTGQLDDFNGQDSVPPSSRSGANDQDSSATGFGGGGGGIGDSKYFQYQHLPEHDKYEFGYRRGNEHHVRERHEKAVPHDGHFKTKVRWADHKGGNGEHYWDYNHAGHHDDGEGEGSDPVPSYTASQTDDAYKYPARSLPPSTYEDHTPNRRAFPYEDKENKEHDPIRSFHDEISQVQGFEVNRQEDKPLLRPKKRESEKTSKKGEFGASKNPTPFTSTPRLYFDMKNGKVVDEATGKTYFLQEMNF